MLDDYCLKTLKAKAPIYVREEIPLFKTLVDKQLFYEKKHRLWSEGNGTLTGAHIHYLDNIPIQNRVTGRKTYPIARDVDVIIYHQIELKRKLKRWLYITKGRGLGLSTIGFTLLFWFWRMFPGSTCVATTGKDKKTLARLFKKYTLFAYDKMDENTRFGYKNRNATMSESYLNVNVKVINDKGEEEIMESSFECRETTDSPDSVTAFSGYGAIYGLFDEVPLHKRRSDLLKSAKEIFIDPDTKKIEGFLLAGGTIEEKLTPDDLAAIRNFIENCEALNFDSIFIPATWGRNMENGWSDLAKAEAEIMAERAELNKLDDKSFLHAHIKNNPLSLEEIFDLGGSNRWDQYTIEKINFQKREVENKKGPPVFPYIIISNGNKVHAEPSTKGRVKILEPPVDGVKYILGVDGIMTSELTQSDNSKGLSQYAAMVMKGVHPGGAFQFSPVALYSERPKSIEDANRMALEMLRYYNQFGRCRSIGELNAAGEHLLQMIINAGLGNTVIYKRALTRTGWVDTKTPWFYRNDVLRDWQFEAANVYFKKHVDTCWFRDLLEDCGKPENYNTDVLDAFLACLYGWGTGDLLGEKPKENRKSTMWVKKGTKADGSPNWVQISVG